MSRSKRPKRGHRIARIPMTARSWPDHPRMTRTHPRHPTWQRSTPSNAASCAIGRHVRLEHHAAHGTASRERGATLGFFRVPTSRPYVLSWVCRSRYWLQQTGIDDEHRCSRGGCGVDDASRCRTRCKEVRWIYRRTALALSHADSDATAGLLAVVAPPDGFEGTQEHRPSQPRETLLKLWRRV